MPDFAWFSSLIFLGFSVSLGVLVYMIFYKKKKKSSSRKKSATLEELERQYGKKGLLTRFLIGRFPVLPPVLAAASISSESFVFENQFNVLAPILVDAAFLAASPLNFWPGFFGLRRRFRLSCIHRRNSGWFCLRRRVFNMRGRRLRLRGNMPCRRC